MQGKIIGLLELTPAAAPIAAIRSASALPRAAAYMYSVQRAASSAQASGTTALAASRL